MKIPILLHTEPIGYLIIASSVHFLGELSKDTQIVVLGLLMHQQINVTFILLTPAVASLKKEKTIRHGSLVIIVLYAGLQRMNAPVLCLTELKNLNHNFWLMAKE